MKMLTYNPTVLVLQGGAGGADGAAGTALVGRCFASAAVEGWARTVGAGRRRAAGEGRTGTHSLAGDRTLPWEEQETLTAYQAGHCWAENKRPWGKVE